MNVEMNVENNYPLYDQWIKMQHSNEKRMIRFFHGVENGSIFVVNLIFLCDRNTYTTVDTMNVFLQNLTYNETTVNWQRLIDWWFFGVVRKQHEMHIQAQKLVTRKLIACIIQS